MCVSHDVNFAGFSLLPNRLSEPTLSSRGSQGVGLEKLNQTWPPPSSGRHSPRIPKSSSNRGRRILEPLKSTSPHDGNIINQFIVKFFQGVLCRAL